MKNKYALTIVFAASLGILFVITNTVFFNEEENPIISGLGLFKYFTLQSNLIVAIYFSMYLRGNYKENLLFNRLLGGVVVYISITFIVFLTLLEPIYSPKGFALVGSIFNHYVTPILVMGFLYKFRNDYSFKYSDTKVWISYPLIYLAFLLVNGLITNDYLYPFFNVNKIGVIGSILSVVVITIMFVLMSFSLVKIVSKK